MRLLIDTISTDRVTLTLSGKSKPVTHTFRTDHNLSENLVPEIRKFLAKQKIKLAHLQGVGVVTGDGHFSRLRTAVATANALAFGLELKQALFKPRYSGQPNITLLKQK